MNTNDFYKELFERYALDEEKIRKNAIKAAKTPAWKRTLGTHWKTAVGAAAAVAVTVGAVAYTAANPSGNVDIVTSQDMPTAYKRLQDAEQNYYNPPAEDESRADVFVSFIDTLSYSDMSVSLSALDCFDDIDILCLYLTDGSKITGVPEVASFAEGSGSVKCIAGVKLLAPAGSFRDIWDLSTVYIAELASAEINDDTFSPIPYDDSDPLADDEFIITTAEQITVTSTAFSFVETTAPVTVVSDSTPASSDTSPAVTEDISDDTTAAPGENDAQLTSDSTETGAPDSQLPETGGSYSEEEEDEEPPEPEETDTSGLIDTGIEEDDDDVVELEDDSDDSDIVYTEETEQEPEYETTIIETSVPVTEVTEAPAVGLMTQMFQLNVENALETVLTGDHAIVLTRTGAYIYKIGGLISGQPKVCETTNPKLAYSDSSIVILSGCGADGLRNVIITIDLNADSVYLYDASAVLGGAEIATIHHSASDGRYYLKAISASSTYFYELSQSTETGVAFRPLVEYPGAVSSAGSRNGILWFTASKDNVNYDLYAFDCLNGALSVVKSFGSVCKVRRSPGFESFIVTGSDRETGENVSYVFDASSQTLIPAEIGGEALIASKNGNIYIGQNGSVYALSADGTLTESAVRISFTRPAPSSDYTVVSTDTEKVVVAEKASWL